MVEIDVVTVHKRPGKARRSCFGCKRSLWS